LKTEEVRTLEYTLNAKQVIALIWTLIAVVISFIVVFALGFPYNVLGVSYSSTWPVLVALFFGILLVITLPMYLFMALWQVLSKSDTA
jgi:uncharacterized membrane protein